MLEHSDDILSVDEVCEILKVGHNAVYRLLNAGEIKAFRNGRIWRIPKQGLLDYITETSKISLCKNTR